MITNVTQYHSHTPTHTSHTQTHQIKYMKILHLDSHLAIVVKRSNQLTVPHAASTSPTTLDDLVSHLKTTNQRHFVQSVHRLDYVVGGLTLFGRSDKGVKRLTKMMAERSIEKWYIAKAAGPLYIPESNQKKGVIKMMVETNRFASLSDKNSSRMKLAKSHYEVLDEKSNLVRFKLDTGRRHQLRLAALHHFRTPLMNDTFYGAPPCETMDGIGLFSSRLKFVHPVTQENFDVRVPDEFLPDWVTVDMDHSQINKLLNQ